MSSEVTLSYRYKSCMSAPVKVGAAVLGVRVKATIKEVRADGLVVRTLERASLWEVQTPQVRGAAVGLEYSRTAILG